MKNMINYVTNGDLVKMLIDKGHSVNPSDWLYEHALKENLEGKSILDYGFNNGNLLRSIPDDVDFSYTGVEVQQDFLTSMSERYPEHTFIHMNKYHHSYNFNGNKKILDKFLSIYSI